MYDDYLGQEEDDNKRAKIMIWVQKKMTMKDLYIRYYSKSYHYEYIDYYNYNDDYYTI